LKLLETKQKYFSTLSIISFDFGAFDNSLLDRGLFSTIIVVLHFVYLPTMVSVVYLEFSLVFSSVVKSCISIDFLSSSDECSSILENLLSDFSWLVVFDLGNLEFLRNYFSFHFFFFDFCSFSWFHLICLLLLGSLVEFVFICFLFLFK